MKGKIQVGYLVSYDYEMLRTSLLTTYSGSDSIFLAIDRNRKTWNGESFVIEDSFFEWMKIFDTEKKIIIYEDDFYVPTFTTMQCEIRERKMLAEKMGAGNWIVQVDCDEYFIDFKQFVSDLRKYDAYLLNPEKHPIQICAYWIMLYKYTNNGILYVDKPLKAIFATNYPDYKNGRRINNRQIYTNNIVLHESLSRTEEELRFKFENWGHNIDVNKDFLKKWLIIDENNYKDYKDFYYLQAERWKKLAYFPSKNFDEIREIIRNNTKLNVSFTNLLFKNFGQKIKFFFKRILKKNISINL